MTDPDPPHGGTSDPARALAMLQANSPGSGAAVEPDHDAMGVRLAEWWLKARRLREDMFGNEHFSDPAWDILLDLYVAGARSERVQVTSLAIAARVPHSTAIRWARVMTSHGWLVRETDPGDARRIHIALSEATRAMMKNYFECLSRDAAMSYALFSIMR